MSVVYRCIAFTVAVNLVVVVRAGKEEGQQKVKKIVVVSRFMDENDVKREKYYDKRDGNEEEKEERLGTSGWQETPY